MGRLFGRRDFAFGGRIVRREGECVFFWILFDPCAIVVFVDCTNPGRVFYMGFVMGGGGLSDSYYGRYVLVSKV